jgi:hypothetical protein
VISPVAIVCDAPGVMTLESPPGDWRKVRIRTLPEPKLVYLHKQFGWIFLASQCEEKP